MQAVVDFCGLFLDTYIGWPGKVHDARVFSNSSVYRKGNREGTLLPAWKRQINGDEACNLMMYNEFIFVSDSTTDIWRSSLPYTTMADETVRYHSEHDYRTKTVQLPSKQSSNTSRECFWLIKRTMAMSAEANGFCAGKCSQCCGYMCSST